MCRSLVHNLLSQDFLPWEWGYRPDQYTTSWLSVLGGGLLLLLTLFVHVAQLATAAFLLAYLWRLDDAQTAQDTAQEFKQNG